MAILGASSAWGDWVGVVLSVLTVPGLILACCGGLDWALGRSGRHQLRVDERGVLHVHSPGGVRKIDLRGASVDVDRHASHVGTASGTTRATTWVLSVTGANGDSLRQAMPSFGTTTTEEDYLALQRELRRRT